MTDLGEIAKKYGADKGPQGWGYTSVYADWLKGKTIKAVLELGVYAGASLFMWRDYLSDAHIYGVDNDLHFFAPDGGNRITTIHCDAYSDMLRPHIAEIGPIDFIVDDCVHNSGEQVHLLNSLWPYLRPGGIYAIEETRTGLRGTIATAIQALPDVKRHMFWHAQDIYWLTIIERKA